MTPLWLALVIAAVGSYLLKLAGVSLPESILNHPKVQRVAKRCRLPCWPRWSGRAIRRRRPLRGGLAHPGRVAAGVVALLLRRGFLVVFLIAIAVTALLRLVT